MIIKFVMLLNPIWIDASRLKKSLMREMRPQQEKKLEKEFINNLIDFYKKFGFKYIRKSDSTHGGLVWHEMVLSL